ncbi:Hypothetical predicted protein [Cloeon dipterum]|uniref:Serendipity locus protein alpha n=1 Tax=Cloeon dipterum TaxID=197152 RepID=A0A8S1C3I3_9INSE|nr:Hypothetical predicted protein [Cloeon dipterum]
MEQRIKSVKLYQIWKSINLKVKNIDLNIVQKVENELNDNNFANERESNLLETIDSLHDRPAKSSDVFPRVFSAYQALCLAILKQEKERDSKLEDAFKQCRRLTLNLKLPASHNITGLKELVQAYKKVVRALLKTADGLRPKDKGRHILLADQINASLELLIKAIATFEADDKNSSKTTQTATEYVLGRLLWCVKDTHFDEDANDCGQFLEVMDEVLDALEGNSSSNPDVGKLKSTCQTLLTHAMSVAHVALQQDCQDIFYISQKVLSRAESLCKEESANLINLQLGALADNLLQLEIVVNNALLRLVLEVFADVDASIAKLTTADKDSGDFEKRVSDFDMYVDRVMQIGLFAIACSSDVKRVSSVRSCLASIESLEPEFVPSVQAMVSGKGDAELVKFFENHWKNEVRRLETLLDQLIDPAAFAQIVATQVTALQSSTLTAPKLVLCASKLRNLISHLDAVELDLSSELIKKFDFYLAELRAALEQPPCDKWERRVLERARLLSKSVQVIAQELVDHSITVESHWSESQTQTKTASIPTEDEIIPEEEPARPRNLLNPSFPESVRDLPLDITESCRG